MATLHRKLARDLRRSIGVLLTIVVIIAVGIGSFIGFGSAQRILKASQAAYYRQYRFADFWVDVKKAPLSAVEQIAKLPGVASINARVGFDVILDLPDVSQPLTGRLISIPERGFDETLNAICLTRGSGFSSDRPEEVILGDAFAKAHGLEPGDRIQLILNRKQESFVIVGTAISPEYVYMVRGEGDVMPDPEHFAILYVKDHYARDVLDFQDACNQIVGAMVPGAEDKIDATLERIDRMLDPYGVLATTPRDRQASHRFLSDEIEGLGISATFMPAIFLMVAALVLNILMSRFAERQRVIVGTLKALGYSDRTVLLHFLSFGIVVGVAGGAAGGALGVAVTYGMIEMYKMFFQFPTFLYRTYPDLLLIGMTISVGFSVAGCAKGALSVLKLQPAEAMRLKPPERGGRILLERFPMLWRRLSFRTHIALRSLFRNRVRTLSAIFSSALATAIVLASLVMYDSMVFLVYFQFDRVMHSDVDIGMRDEKSIAALFEARRLPGVDYAEPVLGLRCDLRNGRQSRRMTISGFEHHHRLTTPMSADLQPVRIPDEGLVMSAKLADILGVRVGDPIELTPVRGRRRTVTVHLSSVIESFLGLECYANLEYLSRIVGEDRAVNSVQLAADPVDTDRLFHAIKTMPNAQGVSVTANARAAIESTFVATMLATLGMCVIFAGTISFGSTLNHSMVEISDRIRDIATFRVLGYGPREISGIFFRQTLVTFVVGLAASIPIGYWMVLGLASAYDSELFRMPVFIRPRTVLITAAISLVFVLISQFFVRRQINKLDWQEGIKVKE
ncbi:MAG: ABC transporter permease [Phycisphaerae bacterium]|nr:ABC transporter permease [Phycisphaerae bacterium]